VSEGPHSIDNDKGDLNVGVQSEQVGLVAEFLARPLWNTFWTLQCKCHKRYLATTKGIETKLTLDLLFDLITMALSDNKPSFECMEHTKLLYKKDNYSTSSHQYDVNLAILPPRSRIYRSVIKAGGTTTYGRMRVMDSIIETGRHGIASFASCRASTRRRTSGFAPSRFGMCNKPTAHASTLKAPLDKLE